MTLETNIREYLEWEAKRIREEYPTNTVSDLEKIAEDEYNANIVRTFLAPTPTVCNYTGERYIFYTRGYDKVNIFSLGHEIGHIAAGHLGTRHDLTSKIAEKEANFFSKSLIGSSKPYAQYIINDFHQILLSPLYFINRGREKKRVVDLGVYEAYKKHIRTPGTYIHSAANGILGSLLICSFIASAVTNPSQTALYCAFGGGLGGLLGFSNRRKRSAAKQEEE